MKATFWRFDIVLNTKTLEVADVQTDSFGGLPRRLIPVRVNCYGDCEDYNIQWRSEDCLKVGGTWAQAWLKLRQLRDDGVFALIDPRLGLPAEIEVLEVA